MTLTIAAGTLEDVDLHAETDFTDAHTERRRGLRVRQARPIRVYEPSGARYFGGVTEDISATGLRIELPASAALRPGKIVNVHVGAGARGVALANRRHMIPAKVVWIDAGETLGVVVAGVEFIPSIAAHLDAA
jgi:hypothetical protein